MQNNWGMQDPDWQLRRLQQDCVRTSDKALAVLFASIQQDVVLVHQEYEKIFGPNSAQFAEYITMILQKLNSQGICSRTCGDWLVAASSGVIPPVHASASFNSQSQTLKQIPGEFRDQLETTLEHSRLPDDAEFESLALTSGDGQTWPPQIDSAHETFLPQPAGADLIQEANGFNNPWGDSASESPTKTSKTGLNSLMPASMEGVSPFSQPDYVRESIPQPLAQRPEQSPIVQSQPFVQPVVQAEVQSQPSNPWDSFDDNPVVPAPQFAQPGVYGQNFSQSSPLSKPAPVQVFAETVMPTTAQSANSWPSAQPAAQPYMQHDMPAATAQSMSGGQPVFQQQISQAQPPVTPSPWGIPAQQATQPAFDPQISEQIAAHQAAYQQAAALPQQSAYAQQISQTNQIPQSGFQPNNNGGNQAQPYQGQYNQQYSGAVISEPQQAAQPAQQQVYSNVPNASMSGGWWDKPGEENAQWENQRQDSVSDEKDPNYTYDPATAWD